MLMIMFKLKRHATLNTKFGKLLLLFPNVAVGSSMFLLQNNQHRRLAKGPANMSFHCSFVGISNGL